MTEPNQRPLAACRFPFAEPLTLQSGDTVSSAEVYEAMAQFIGPERLARMDQVWMVEPRQCLCFLRL
jgi:hypothetical protein